MDAQWTVELIGCPASWDACVAVCDSEEEARRAASAYWSHLTASEREQAGSVVLMHGDEEIEWATEVRLQIRIGDWDAIIDCPKAGSARECLEAFDEVHGSDISSRVRPRELRRIVQGEGVNTAGWSQATARDIRDIEQWLDDIHDPQDDGEDYPATGVRQASATVQVRKSGGSLVLSATSALTAIGAQVGDYVQVTVRRIQ